MNEKEIYRKKMQTLSIVMQIHPFLFVLILKIKRIHFHVRFIRNIWLSCPMSIYLFRLHNPNLNFKHLQLRVDFN